MIAIAEFGSGQISVSSPAVVHPPLHWKHRVRTKLIALVALMVVPIAVVGFFHAHSEYHRHVEMELQTNLELADSVSHAFRNYAEGLRHTSEILARTLYPHGNPISPERAGEILAAQALAHPNVDDFAWFDKTGALIAASDIDLGFAAASMPYFERLQNGEDWLVANMASEHDDGRALLVVASAIHDGSELIGGIAAIASAQTLDRVLPVERRRGRTISLADQNDFLAYVIPPEEVPPAARRLQLDDPLRGLIQDGAYTFLDYQTPWDGIARIGAVVPIPEIGWFVIAAAPRHEVVGPLIASQSRNVLVVVAAAALSIGFASLIASDLSRRLHRLWEAASSWSRADFEVRAEVWGEDELSRTAVTFNEMAARLQRLEEEREQFLHAAAHEMANPVTGILSVVQLLRHRIRRGHPPIDPANLDTKLAAIERDANTLARLIPDTARLYSQEQSWAIRPEPIELVSLFCEMVDAMRARCEHVVNLDVGSFVELWVDADRERLKQVMRNVLNNAIKYSPTGEAIDICLSRRDGKVTISVRDQGVGIPPGDEELIFQSFHRSENVQAIPGSGLGLFVSRQIINAHGGRIWAENNPDRGATFYVQLPG